jgi:hypothetical protein
MPQCSPKGGSRRPEIIGSPADASGAAAAIHQARLPPDDLPESRPGYLEAGTRTPGLVRAGDDRHPPAPLEGRLPGRRTPGRDAR